jgi:hypothetical protein
MAVRRKRFSCDRSYVVRIDRRDAHLGEGRAHHITGAKRTSSLPTLPVAPVTRIIVIGQIWRAGRRAS